MRQFWVPVYAYFGIALSVDTGCWRRDQVLLDAIQFALERSRTALGHESELRLIGERYAQLSRREREVMALVVTGLLNKQVGSELGISASNARPATR